MSEKLSVTPIETPRCLKIAATMILILPLAWAYWIHHEKSEAWMLVVLIYLGASLFRSCIHERAHLVAYRSFDIPAKIESPLVSPRTVVLNETRFSLSVLVSVALAPLMWMVALDGVGVTLILVASTFPMLPYWLSMLGFSLLLSPITLISDLYWIKKGLKYPNAAFSDSDQGLVVSLQSEVNRQHDPRPQ